MASSLGGSSILGTEQVQPDHLPRKPTPARTSPPSSSRRARDHLDEKRYLLNRNDTKLDQHLRTSSIPSARTADSVDLEKQALGCAQEDGRDRRSSQRSSPRRSGDRRSGLAASHIYMVGSVAASSPHHQTIRQISEGEDEVLDRSTLAAKGVRILLFFTFLLPFLAFALSIWSVVLVIVLTLLHPIRLIFTRKRAYSDIVLDLLAPAINLHLKWIYSSPVAPTELRLVQTLSVLICGSAFAFCLSIWCAVLVVYWAFAAVIGNPDGLDGRSDGRELVLTTRQKWDGFLRCSVKPDLR